MTMIKHHPHWLAFAILAFVSLEPAGAIGFQEHPANRPLPAPEYADPPDTERPASPPAPALPVTAGATFLLQGIRFEGNSVFSDEELSALAAPYLNRPVSLVDLEALRIQLTEHYPTTTPPATAPSKSPCKASCATSPAGATGWTSIWRAVRDAGARMSPSPCHSQPPTPACICAMPTVTPPSSKHRWMPLTSTASMKPGSWVSVIR